VRRLPFVVLVAVVLAGCGSSKQSASTTVATPVPPGHVIYQGATWAVSLRGSTATAYHLVGGSWRADTSGDPKLDILGPKPGSTVAAIPQVAFQVAGKTDLVDTALWVDGVEVLGKGGGLTPKRGTVYGAPTARLRKGTHVAVAYGRDARHASAVAWTFHV
jgi:hypothetical protein